MKNDDKQLTEVGKLNDRLKELFKLDENFVVTLNGKWGVGKTYF
ncbi:P-loop NTPase fold protein [Aliarcobacter butzleri]|nr:P-loop NTPase fold protein [Aliarcobacter butzleri]